MSLRFVVAALALCAAPSRAADLQPLVQEEERLNRELQSRVQEMLDRLIGIGRAAVSVSVSLELTPEAKSYVDARLAPPKEKASGGFDWSWAPSSDGSAAERFILPGFRDDAGPQARDLRQYLPEAIGPAVALAVGTRIRRISVRMLLDPGISEEAQRQCTDAIAALISFDGTRGDELQVGKMRMPPPYERLLRDPAAWSGSLVRILIALLGCMALAATLVAGESWRRSLERSVDRVSGAILASVRSRAPEAVAPELGAPGRPGAPAGSQAPGEEKEPEGVLVFDIAVEQVPRLCDLLRRESPANIALVLPHLKPEVYRGLLAQLPPETSAKAIAACAPVRYVDPALIETLKDELESRLRGLTGGVEHVVALLREAGPRTRGEILNELRAIDPAVAGQLAGRVLLFEDLWQLQDRELAEWLGRADLGELGLALSAEGEATRRRVLGLLTGTARGIVEQGVRLAASADSAKLDAARQALVAAAERLLDEGKLKLPSRALGVAIPEGGAAARA
ncbi:MAG: hypothetical protein HY554_13150 [Elusimicrobia bacterium]|nr:hypothetical protein [Elusimicrobiota bacterium]